MSKKSNKIDGYSFTFNQSYPTVYTVNSFSMDNVDKLLAVTEEVRRLDAVDKIVDNMNTYPDAEKLLNNLGKN